MQLLLSVAAMLQSPVGLLLLTIQNQPLLAEPVLLQNTLHQEIFLQT